jgi:hypothetical protein
MPGLAPGIFISDALSKTLRRRKIEHRQKTGTIPAY